MSQMYHDEVVSLRAFATCRRVQLGDTLALYRQHRSNVAGDPTPRGLRLVTETLRPRFHDFAELADIVNQYSAFLVSFTTSTGPQRYFTDLGARCRLRASIYSSPYGYRCARRIGHAARSGVYSRKSRGGFGTRALLRDLGLTTAMSVRHSLARAESHEGH